MTEQTFILEYEADYGPVLKVLADATNDPDATPDTDFDKWRFNSKTADLTPIHSVQEVPHGFIGSGTPIFQSNGIGTVGSTTAVRLYLPMNGANSWDYSPVADFFLARSDGWNYPNHWAGDDPSHFADNNWGTNMNFEYRFSTTEGNPYRQLVVGSQFVPWGTGDAINFVLFDLPGMACVSPDDGTNSPSQLEDAYIPWADAQTPVSGHDFFFVSPTELKLARPGYDLNTATEQQLIFGDVPRPLLYFTKRVTIAAGATQTFPLPVGTPDNAVCLMQWQNTDDASRFLPAMWIGTRSDGLYFEARWKIENEVLTVENIRPAQTDYLLIVIGCEPHATSETNPMHTGVDNSGKKYFQLNKAGYTVLDTRYGYLPLIKSGTEVLSGVRNTLGLAQSSVTVDFPAQGYIPFVLAYLDSRLEWSITFTDTGNTVHFDQRRIRPFRYYFNDADVVDSRSFTATVGADSVQFNWFHSNYFQDANVSPVYCTPFRLNYFIFGVPNFD